jgi:hypothetical protein
MGKMPWEEDWSQPQGAPGGMGGYPTITIPRDPRQVAREDRTDARADRSEARAMQTAERVTANDAARLDMERRRLALAEQAAAGKQPGKQDMDAVRAEALDKIRLARTLQQRSRDGWFTTGIGSNAAGLLPGTPAYDLARDTETLKNAGALTRIMDMAKQNGGKNPLTPLSNADFQALSSSLTNLDPGQSDEQYQANVQRTIDLYERAYQGAGGTDLEGDLDPSKKRKRDAAPTIGAAAPAGMPPAGGGDGGQADRTTIPYGDGGPGGGAATLATGAYKTEADPALAGVNARVATMLRSGVPDAQIREFLAKSGAGERANPAASMRRSVSGASIPTTRAATRSALKIGKCQQLAGNASPRHLQGPGSMPRLMREWVGSQTNLPALLAAAISLISMRASRRHSPQTLEPPSPDRPLARSAPWLGLAPLAVPAELRRVLPTRHLLET